MSGQNGNGRVGMGVTDPALQSRLDALQARYDTASHAMQSGVKWELEQAEPIAACSPKHLRTGVNSAMVDTAAMAELLIRKGLISTEEYMTALAEGMEAEVRRYRERIAALAGVPVDRVTLV